MLINSILSSLPTTLPRREAELIVAQVIGTTRAWVIAHPEAELSEKQLAQINEKIEQMTRGIPLPYVLGEWEFFGLMFKVTPAVLIPRPETELLIETAMSNEQRSISKIADIGTGSGIIAITLAIKLSNAEIFATDISAEALKVAKENAQKHNITDRIKFIHDDLLNSIGKVDLMCANLPYIATKELESLEVTKHEPHLALDGGADGLRLIERLLISAPDHLQPNGIILAEIEATQGARALALAQKYFPQAQSEVKKDLAGLDRLLVINC